MAARALLAAAALAAASAPSASAAPAAERPAPPGSPQASPGAARKLEFPKEPSLPEVPPMNPHDDRGAPYCAWCHEGRDPRVQGDPVALCASCHPPSIMKHPYGRPAKQVPGALPLGEGGRIVCHTCHDPHDVKAHGKGLRLEFQALCAECHAGHGKKAKLPTAQPATQPPRAQEKAGAPHPASGQK